MVSSASIPWYMIPARPFPAKDWLARRYPFLVSPSAFAQQATQQAPARREFPAKVWLEERRAGG